MRMSRPIYEVDNESRIHMAYYKKQHYQLPCPSCNYFQYHTQTFRHTKKTLEEEYNGSRTFSQKNFQLKRTPSKIPLTIWLKENAKKATGAISLLKRHGSTSF
jgi:hypothetical protein